MALQQCAPAKINLALHVRERLDNGYHLLDTIFAFVADGDNLSADHGSGLHIDIVGPFAHILSADNDNLVLKAAMALAEAADISADVHFTLEKRLPVASGIGGGSADAAAALRLCNILWGLHWPYDKLAEIGLQIGADVPACLRSISCHGTGIGERLAPILNPEWQDLPIILINPLKPIATAKIFAAWNRQDKGALSAPLHKLENIIQGRNDLTPMAMALCPDIIAVLDHLATTEPLLSRMSGSGATCFAIYSDMSSCERAVKQIKQAFPKAWIMTSRLHDWAYDNGQ